MKKVKVTVNKGSPGRTLPIFSSPEAAYVWLTEAHDDPTVIDRIEDVELVELLPGELIEAEWRGCEFTGYHTNYVRIDVVRFAKVSPSQNASGNLVSIHYGFTADCIMPFKSYKDTDITVEPIQFHEANINLEQLFKDDEEE